MRTWPNKSLQRSARLPLLWIRSPWASRSLSLSRHLTCLLPFFVLAVMGVGCAGSSKSAREPIAKYRMEISPTQRQPTPPIAESEDIDGKDETIVRTHYRADANPPPSLREYDRKMLDRIRKRWQQEKLDGKAAGKGVVKVGFRLGADGNVSDVHVIETSLPAAAEAGKRAIILSAPFESWPQDVLQLLEGKPREILINFGYVLK